VSFLADESVDLPIVKFLRENNISIDYILEIKADITDDQMINLANQKQRILITADKDFGEVIFRHNI
jgi:predicted nuclease of predicted toxin-antitoxin system